MAPSRGKAAGGYDEKSNVVRGTGGLIGTRLEGQGNRAQRDDTRREYEKIIAGYSGQLRGRDLRRTWDDLHHRWEPTLKAKGIGQASAALRCRSNLALD